MKNVAFLHTVSRSLGMALAVLVGALMLAPTEASAMTLPGLELTTYCQNTYGSSAYATLTSNNAFGWTCRLGSQNLTMDLSAACQQQHTDGYEADYLDYADPYSWYCRLRANYTTLNSVTYTMYAWKGRNVALRVPNKNCGTVTGAAATRAIMKIIDAVDSAYDFYYSQTAWAPTQNKHYQGLLSIAALPSGATMNCAGNACGIIGQTGIELTASTFETMCNAVNQSTPQYDQTPFYELGRNFYFYPNQLNYQSPQQYAPVQTGYAVAMRFLSMANVGLNGAPINGYSFSTAKSAVEGLVDAYRTNSSENWSNTLATDTAPSNSYGLGAADLFASIVLRLERQHPGQYVYYVWWYAGQMTSASSTADAVDKFVTASCKATGANLYDLFSTTWKFNVTMSTAYSTCYGYGSPVNAANYY